MSLFVDFQPVGLRGEFSKEDSLLDCARQLGVDLVSLCGGGGSCGRCKVQIISGKLSERSPVEESALTEEESGRVTDWPVSPTRFQTSRSLYRQSP